MTTPHSESPTDQTDAPNAPRSDAPEAPDASNDQRLTLKICVLFYELEPGLFQDFIRCFQTDLLAKYPGAVYHVMARGI